MKQPGYQAQGLASVVLKVILRENAVKKIKEPIEVSIRHTIVIFSRRAVMLTVGMVGVPQDSADSSE
ncbi:uncharacterized protein PHALS_04612 [Plasmopara halstedii]|uniref:Uncharacterized protein n=1 Tax=Plasmopara halstedii TaxID=4781 RepID=A0A0P1A9X6_PLAHL|nr:uncharacterized protein PHALS_04612 [Plasmopara halstedii]CEG37164.1 hypothetical protein PHALS_04612 [Plasmopara halstedii]|eukprot:XP_024573533.1 hypothetical protein PHALS_04612 [Plasmopara halstedii]